MTAPRGLGPLADAITDQGSLDLLLQTGTVLAVNGDGTLSVDLAGAPLTLPKLNSYVPVVGDAVTVVNAAGRRIVLGRPGPYVGGSDTRPIFQAAQTVAQALTNGVIVPITFTTEDVDTHNGHSTSTNPSRYVAQTAGWYRIGGTIMTNGTTAVRAVTMLKNGVEIPGANTLSVANSLGDNRDTVASRLVSLAVNDYVEIASYVEADSVSTRIDGSRRSTFTVEYVRPL